MAIVRKLVSIVAAAVAASVLASAPAGAQSSAFGDVADDDFYSAAVEALAASGVFAGTECAEQKLCPGAPVDRKTMAVWTVRVVDVEEPVGVYESRFDDVGADSFHAPFIERMADLRITVGCGDGSGFCPDDPVTRAEMAVFLTRAFSLPDGPDPGFADVSGGAWYLDEVAALAGSGITRGCGDGSGFCPEEATSRAQMAVFLHRAVNADIDRPTVRVSGGDTVRVPRGSMLAAEVGEVAVDAPAGTFSDDVQVTLAETVAGTGGVPEGEELATAPLAVSVTGAEVVRPMTLRFEVDTDALIPTGATPAWWSDELGTWVPLEADSMVIGDGVVTVKATLADAAPTAAAASASQVMVHAAVGAASGGIHPVEPVSAAVVVGAVVVGLIFVGGAAITTGVALSSDTVHDALKRFFGLVADEPECSAGLPSWVAALSDSDAALSKERARLHVCGETAGSDLRVKVVNNRNYGVVLRSAHGRDEASVTDQTNPTDLFEIIVKEMAQEVIGDSYIWPLTRGEFLLPTQSVDWHTTLKITESTAIVDGIRLGLDLLAIVLPEIDVRFNRILCIKELTNRLIDESFQLSSPRDWKEVLYVAAECIDDEDDNLSQKTREALKEVKKALKYVNTAASAAKWGLTAADEQKDQRRPPARITVAANDRPELDAPTGVSFESISAGLWHSCGILTNGQARCWGRNDDYDYGQANAPTDVRFNTIDTGAPYSCGILTSGQARCWGQHSLRF